MFARKDTTILTISVNNEIMKTIDEKRQNFSRSAFINNVLLNNLGN